MLIQPDSVDRLSASLLRDLEWFLPELLLCGAIVLMLFARLFRVFRRVHLCWFALAISATALLTHGLTSKTALYGGETYFSGMLVGDSFAWFLRLFLLTFLTLSLWLSLLTGIPDREDSADYSTLLLGGILGMMLMASANHLLIAFIAIEMASLPSYVLSGFLKGKRRGSESALKYVVYGACASGVMLYGISLLAGNYGTGSLTEIGTKIRGLTEVMSLPIAVGSLMILAGLAFKLSAVPFHFWCPDVFQGAPAEVGAFLSVASKGAALALTTRFLLIVVSPASAGGQVAATVMSLGWGLFAVVTATYGNLAALRQTNVKRLLAYSTIAHAGLMMMPLTSFAPEAVGPILFYLSAYLMMNFGAFAVVALVRNATDSEEISAYRGLMSRSPILAVTMAIFLLSLLGLPPLAGFAAKFQIFAALLDAGHGLSQTEPEFGYLYLGLLIAAALNTAIGAGYYLKLLKLMVLDDPDPETVLAATPIRVAFGARALLCLLCGGVVSTGLFWGPLQQTAQKSAESFRKPPIRKVTTAVQP
jgi:NADH-quinone oxidoreductase subunit N